jgi:hypothetical protein
LTAEPLSHRAERLGRVQTALARPRPSYRTAFEKSEELTLGVAERIAEQTREAPKLFAELLAWPFLKRRAMVQVDPRFHSAPLAAMLLDEASEQPDRAEELAETAHWILDRVECEEGKPLRVSAYLVLADAARRRRDENAAESALASASAKLWEWSLSIERAEYCLAVARLRWDQARWDEALAAAGRAGYLYVALGEDVAAADALLQLGDWAHQLGGLEEAATAYTAAVDQEATVEQVLLGTKRLACVLVLLGDLDKALGLVQAMRRERLAPKSPEAYVLQALEGQLLVRSGQMRLARRKLYHALHGLLVLGKPEEALNAGVALLLAGAPAGELAAQLSPLVPQIWPDLREALTETAAEGHVPARWRQTLDHYLFCRGARDGC